jgi:hypothetical protein
MALDRPPVVARHWLAQNDIGVFGPTLFAREAGNESHGGCEPRLFLVAQFSNGFAHAIGRLAVELAEERRSGWRQVQGGGASVRCCPPVDQASRSKRFSMRLR